MIRKNKAQCESERFPVWLLIPALLSHFYTVVLV